MKIRVEKIEKWDVLIVQDEDGVGISYNGVGEQ